MAALRISYSCFCLVLAVGALGFDLHQRFCCHRAVALATAALAAWGTGFDSKRCAVTRCGIALSFDLHQFHRRCDGFAACSVAATTLLRVINYHGRHFYRRTAGCNLLQADVFRCGNF